MVLYIIFGVVGLLLLVGLFLSFFTVKQETVAVVTRFGKFLKISQTGINFKLPFIDSIYSIVSLQNQTSSLKFQAITVDQANVDFNVMLIYAAQNNSEETIKNLE